MDPLITPDELHAALAGPNPPLVLDVRYFLTGRDGQAEFRRSHIPGAHWIDLDRDLAGSPGPGGRHPLPHPEVFQAAMRRVGLRPDHLVIATDDGSTLGAARLWWMLRDAGIEVRVLDGGLAAWVDAGFEVAEGDPDPAEPSQIVLTPGALPSVDTGRVAAVAEQQDVTLWDVRAAERYRGEHEPIDPVAGHIPHARNLPASDSFRDGRFRTPDDLRAQFAEVARGDVVYCGSGLTASQTLLGMAVAGIDGVALYPGSWSAWITDPQRPVAVGDEPASEA